MITVKRKLDDGNGNVHIVQQEEYESLRSLLKVINDNLNLQMNVDTQPADLQDYLENSDLIGDVFEWVTGYIADTDVQMGIIGIRSKAVALDNLVRFIFVLSLQSAKKQKCFQMVSSLLTTHLAAQFPNNLCLRLKRV